MQAGEVLEFLEWDSRFFEARIARVRVNRLDGELAALMEEWCALESIDCLYLLADAADSETVRLAESHGFGLVDIRVTLEREAARGGEATGANRVRLYRPEDLPGLRSIARQSHGDTRFYHDGRFPKDKCDKLYETWIENSCAGQAQAVLVAEAKGASAGYLTCHVSEGQGRIGLVGVAAEHQGSGLGSELVSAAVDWFAGQGVGSIRVVTQGRNLRGIRLYERAGFLARSIQLWYHRWFDRRR